MHIAIIGSGYVGLVSGACLAQFGHDVVCVDHDASKIARLATGEIPIYEPGLERVVQDNMRARRLRFSTDLGDAVRPADAVFIAVGTPSRRGDGFADLSYVDSAARDIARALDTDRYRVIVTKSTVPVGTGASVDAIIRGERADADFDVVSNPEFLREGSAVEDFMRPDRVVIGTESARARAVMQEIYRPLYLDETPMLMTSRQTAELTKYASNAFLATKITFINEIADLCEALGADVQDVAKGMGLDGRIGRKFLHAGPGYGGSCFPKDTLALTQSARAAGVELSIVDSVVAANRRRKEGLARRVETAFGASLADMTIAVLGVSFKPNTDDMRDAPSLDLIPALQAAGARVRAFDPVAMGEAGRLMTAVDWCDDAYVAMEGAHAVVLLTEWNEFRALDLARAHSLLARPLVIDFRNVYRPEAMRQAGFEYVSIGRSRVG